MQNGEYWPDAAGPLKGTRVIDMTRLAAGNMLTHLLADFGAEVIKIERPGVGDDLRRFGDEGVWWKEYARSKKSFTLDFKSKEGRKLLFELVARSDVLVENFVPGTLEKWGMGPAEFLRDNPDLIVIRVSGWGQTGPYAHKPGFGTLIEAMTGFAAMTGFEDRPPLLPPMALADMVAGTAGFGAAAVALLAREKGKARGQVIDLSLFEPLFSVIGPWVAHFKTTGKIPVREGNRTKVAAPRNVYKCSDGKYLALSASMQSMWEKVAHAIGRPELIEDERYGTGSDRVRNIVTLDEIVGGFIDARTLADNLSHFEAAGVTVGPICDPTDLIDHEYIRGRGVVEGFPDTDHGTVPLHGVFPRLSETPGTIRSPAPLLGEHTEEILDLLGVAPEQRDELLSAGIV
ncbi:MAG: CoA transferase [Rhodospirillaceae bacterium]|nr:CoA transferase [Rhodospirillaceae bacterium]